NLFQTSSIATTTFSSAASGRMRDLMTRWERVQASPYCVTASTTAGTSSTLFAPQSAALRSEVSMPATLLSTTVGSGLESGYFQSSAFITEWILSPVFSAAALACSATA